MKLLLLHLSFRGSLSTQQAVRETGRSCLLFGLCSNQTRRVEPLYRSMLGVSGRLGLAKKLIFWKASSKRKANSASGAGRVADAKPHGRPSTVKSSGPSTSLRVNEWRENEKRWRARTKSRAPDRVGMNSAQPLQVRAESQQTAIAILHHELPLVPWHVAKSASEFYALGAVLGIKCVGILNEEVPA